jgi:hypothetical protein
MAKQLALPIGEEKKDEEVVTLGDQPQAILWFTNLELMAPADEKKADTNRQSWRGLMCAGIERFEVKFSQRVRVILYTDPLPKDWECAIPGVEFQRTKGLAKGHFVICNDPNEFFGKEDTPAVLDS